MSLMSLPRESLEYVTFGVTLDGDPVPSTTAVQVSVTPRDERPGMWQSPVIVGTDLAVLVGGYQAGVYRLWVRVTDNPEVPVIDAGLIVIT